MILRDAKPGDLPAIAALHIASWQRTYRGLLPDAFLDDDLPDRMRARWGAQALAGRITCVAFAEGLLGFAVTAPLGDQPPYLDSLHVAAAAQGQGVGRALMRAVAQRLRARGADSLALDVLQGNDRALAAYGALGGVAGAPVPAQVFGHPVTDIPVRWDGLGPLLKK